MSTIADYVASARIWTDRILGVVPGPNIPVQLTDIFQQKVYLPRVLQQNPKDRYYTYLKEKALWRCLVLLIPILGAVICLIYDNGQTKKKQEAIDAITKNGNFDAFSKCPLELQKEIYKEKPDLFEKLELDKLKTVFKEYALFEAASDDIQKQILKDKYDQKEMDALKKLLPIASEKTQKEFAFDITKDPELFQHMSEKIQRTEIDKVRSHLQYATKEIQESYLTKDPANLEFMEPNLQIEKIKGQEAALLKFAHINVATGLINNDVNLLKHAKPDLQKSLRDPQIWIRFMSDDVQLELITSDNNLLNAASLNVQVEFYNKNQNQTVFTLLSDAAQMFLVRQNKDLFQFASNNAQAFLNLSAQNIQQVMAFISQNQLTDVFSQLLSEQQYWMLSHKNQQFNDMFEKHAANSARKLLNAKTVEEQIQAVQEDKSLSPFASKEAQQAIQQKQQTAKN